MRLELNLATRRHYNRQGVVRGLWLVIGGLALVVVAGIGHLYAQQRDISRLTKDIGRFEQQLSGQPAGVSEKDAATQKQRVSAVNAILERRSGNSWLGLLDALETVVPDGVALTSVALDPKTNQLKLEGRVKGFAAIKQMLENFDQSQRFREALLVSHSEVVFGDRARGLQFTVSARVVSP